jgi:hypothetical protein
MRRRKLWGSAPGTRFAQERGAVAVMVAILSTVLFGFAAFAIDLGNSWQTRRHLITASDAAALAAAKDYVTGINGCAVSAPDFVERNFSGATMESCTTGGSQSSGWVKVTAAKEVDWKFAAVLGKSDQTERSSTKVSWGSLGAGDTIVPFGICNGDPRIEQWRSHLADGATAWPPEFTPPYHFSWTDPLGASASECNPLGASDVGNLALLDFSGNGGGIAEVKCRLDRALAESQGIDCGDAAPLISIGDILANQTSSGQQGAELGGLQSFMQAHLPKPCTSNYVGDRPEWEWIVPVYDAIVGANGNTITYTVVQFVAVDVYCWNFTGQQSSKFLDLRFKRVVTEGESGGGGGLGVSVINICDIDSRSSGTC